MASQFRGSRERGRQGLALSAAVVRALGEGARLCREAGLGLALTVLRDGADALLMRLGRPPLRVVLGEMRLYGYLRHRSFLAGLVERPYEEMMRALFLSALQPGVVVVDGGAHIGLYSVLAARALPADARVLAFEPDPYNRQALVFNLTANGLFQVMVSARALADVQGQAVFHASAGTIGSSLMPRPWGELGGAWDVSVETTCLDHEFEGVTVERLVVKLDVEGAEPLVLRGMRQTLHRARSAVVCAEINPEALASGPLGLRGDSLLNELDDLGFTSHFIDEARRVLVPRAEIDPSRKGNLWCVKGAL